MVTKVVKKTAKNAAKRTKKALSREVNVPVPLPNNKVGAFLGKSRSWIPKYFKDSWREIKKVKWPNRKESLKLTLAVVLFTAFFTVTIALIDAVFSQVVERVIL